MFKPIGTPNGAGFYQAFSYDPQKLPELWSTPEQRAYNDSTKTCPCCRGWGYKIHRRGREVIRDNVGCETCGGLGKIPKEGTNGESVAGNTATDGSERVSACA
jgi:hypothetical protein